jgi:flagellar motor switch protein FliN/FliY
MTAQSVRPFSFAELPGSGSREPHREMARIGQLNLEVAAVAGGSHASLASILAWKPGEVLELDRAATEPVDLYVHGHLVGRGHIVIVDDMISVRISEIHGDASKLI